VTGRRQDRKASLRLNNDVPAGLLVEVAQLAETVGFDELWVSHDLFLRSAPVLLAAAAGATTRIGIGSCVLNPHSAHPAELAMTAATLQEVSGGRFRLGIGAGDAAAVTARCRWLLARGATHLSFGPPLGPDLPAAVEAIGRQVLPELR
jgi:alkanesulfonate monooxygenase SsuD/methylene tetrahydromethanopterin reductase-like flavin-dependent oxidoreductase (luciferase family)